MSILDSALGYVLGVVLASLTVMVFLRPHVKSFAKEILKESIQEALRESLLKESNSLPSARFEERTNSNKQRILQNNKGSKKKGNGNNK